MQQVLYTARLVLRPCREADLELLHHHWTEPDVRRYLWDGRIVDRDTIQEFIASSLRSSAAHRYGLWLLLSQPQSAFCGVCGLRDGDMEWPDLLYSLSPPYWRTGLATESAYAVLQHAFAVLKLPGVVATVDKPNIASVRVLEKLGMSLTDEKLIQGNPILYYALSRTNFQSVDALL
jgi:ribosomal-protein-alanine N-acetyltransferase